VIIAVVVVVVPIAVIVPRMVVFVPPTMIGGIAPLTLLMHLLAPMFGLAALSPVVLDGFVKVVVDFGHAFLTFIIGTRYWNGSGKGKETCEHCTYE
jgi:hypothetical protein